MNVWKTILSKNVPKSIIDIFSNGISITIGDRYKTTCFILFSSLNCIIISRHKEKILANFISDHQPAIAIPIQNISDIIDSNVLLPLNGEYRLDKLLIYQTNGRDIFFVKYDSIQTFSYSEFNKMIELRVRYSSESRFAPTFSIFMEDRENVISSYIVKVINDIER